VVRLGRRIGKNGLQHWVGAGTRDEMKKNKIIYIYKLTIGNLTKRVREYIKRFLISRI
jgi:hypothetical protein